MCWLFAFAIPARYGLLETETVGNIPGLIGFVSFVFLIFIGYFLVDGSSAKKEHGAGH
ncbi:MAG: hypothetical protein IPO90_12385 [Flavobacteriales bacterium]|nr:hypothetical protein [Flavobacteriales bacterium]